jgi:hypothetical protein
MTDNLSTADVLDRAADLIEPEGAWTKGGYARGASGTFVICSENATCFCALGAISVASNRWGYTDEPDARAVRVLEGLVEGPLSGWNDAPERTQAEVVAKLREAARIARGESRESVSLGGDR